MALLLRGTTTDLIDCQVSRLGISEMLDKAPDILHSAPEYWTISRTK